MKSNNKYTFDTRYKEATENLHKWKNKRRYADELQAPLIEVEIELAEKALAEVQDVPLKNINCLFKACEILGIPRIWIGSRELVGADDIRKAGNWQPAVWSLKNILNGARHMSDGVGFFSGCGNTDQTQTKDTNYFIPEAFIDKAWDVATRTEIKDITPFQKRMVVSDGFKKLKIPFRD